MKKYVLILFGILLLSCHKGQENRWFSKETQQQEIPKNKLKVLKTFLKKNKKYNAEIAIFINFKIPSKNYRFFIVDLKENQILERGLVAHGTGSEVENSDKLVFSNIENSHQSSLGKYEIANRYKGRFGWSYRLKGLDKTNSNAMKRAVVMHPYSMMRDKENGNPSCLSLGCSMLSNTFFKTTEKYIENSKKPMIIYAFY